MTTTQMREQRENAGLSRPQLARTLGVRAETIKGWEYGRTEPTSEQAAEFARACATVGGATEM